MRSPILPDPADAKTTYVSTLWGPTCDSADGRHRGAHTRVPCCSGGGAIGGMHSMSRARGDAAHPHRVPTCELRAFLLTVHVLPLTCPPPPPSSLLPPFSAPASSLPAPPYVCSGVQGRGAAGAAQRRLAAVAQRRRLHGGGRMRLQRHRVHHTHEGVCVCVCVCVCVRARGGGREYA